MKSPLDFPDFLQRMADTIEAEHARVSRDGHSPECKGVFHKDPSKACCPAGADGFDPRRMAALKDLVAAASQLGKEVRMWGEHKATQLDKMSPAKKADVLIRFVQSLPLSARMDIYAVLAREESSRPGGIKLSFDSSFGTSDKTRQD